MTIPDTLSRVLVFAVLAVMLGSCTGMPDEIPPDAAIVLQVVRIDWENLQVVAEPIARGGASGLGEGLLIDVQKTGASLGVARITSVSSDGSLYKMEFQEEAVRLQTGELVGAGDYLSIRPSQDEVLQTGEAGNVDG